MDQNKVKMQFQIDEVEVKDNCTLKGLRLEMEVTMSTEYLKVYVQELPKVVEAISKLASAA
jgi:hypothetical protein